MNTPVVCPKCGEGILYNSSFEPWRWSCTSSLCGETFDMQELNDQWNIDIGDFHDTVSDIPMFPSDFVKIDFEKLERIVTALEERLPKHATSHIITSEKEMSDYELVEREPEWGEIEETLWDLPDAYSQMQALIPRTLTYPETLGFSQDGRL